MALKGLKSAPDCAFDRARRARFAIGLRANRQSQSTRDLDKISFEIQNSRNQARGQMSAQTSMLHIRVDDDTKEQATVALSAMGLSMSDAVRLFLRRVVIDQAFPLELKVPNAETLAAMEESRAMMAKGRAGFATVDELLAELEKNSQA
jgi:DNA-damage-inducible protein J